MIVSELSCEDLDNRLAGPGLRLRTGAFVTCAQSSIGSVAAGIRQLYADYRLAEDSEFCDFYVRLALPGNLRRWWRRQVLFSFDDHAPFAPLPYAHAFPVFEWGLNWCVSQHCHNYLIVHAAVVERSGYAAIFPAPPGSGKSTLCAALVNRGWRLLSDELTLIDLDDSTLTPLPRPVSLKNQSIEVIRRFAPDAVLSRPVADTLKGTVAHMKPPLNAVRREADRARPGWIIFPRYEAGSATKLGALPKSDTFMKLADNCFNYSLLGTRGFDALVEVVDSSDCFEFCYSDLDEAILAFDALAKTTQRE